MNLLSFNRNFALTNNSAPKKELLFTGSPAKIARYKLEELLNQGVSCEKIGKMYNMSTSMVHYFVDLYGLKTNTRKTTDFLDKKMPIYISLQYGLKRILKETELTSDRINRWIEKNIKEKAQIFFERERKKLLLSNLSNTEVAEKLGVDVARVKVLRRAEKHIVGDYAKNERYGRVLNLWKSGMSKEDIAKKFDISIATINRYIREYKKNSLVKK
ncbi:helix-turn-helix domain-containing protein [bacterium]|nr:helix-turn-helix domain-containing protein [bacterium]